MSKITLPDLPYAKDALEPHISAETLEFHHDKHHAAYVNKLNDLLPGSGLEDKTLPEIILATVEDDSKKLCLTKQPKYGTTRSIGTV